MFYCKATSCSLVPGSLRECHNRPTTLQPSEKAHYFASTDLGAPAPRSSLPMYIRASPYSTLRLALFLLPLSAFWNQLAFITGDIWPVSSVYSNRFSFSFYFRFWRTFFIPSGWFSSGFWM